MDTSDFKFIFLGQSVLKYEVPLNVYNTINHIYETRRHELPKANPQLVGKIINEHSLFFDGPPNNKMHPHNFLPLDIKQLNKNIFYEFKTPKGRGDISKIKF